MFNFDIWSPIASGIRDSLQQSDYSDSIGAGLVKEHSLNVFQLCSLCTDINMDTLLDLAKSDALEFSHLLKNVIDVNGAYFKEEVKPGPKRRKKKTDTEHTWFDSFQYLVFMGHRPDDILQMTYGAFTNYLKSAQKQQKDFAKFESNVIRAAYHADKKGFTTFQDELSKH